MGPTRACTGLYEDTLKWPEGQCLISCIVRKLPLFWKDIPSMVMRCYKTRYSRQFLLHSGRDPIKLPFQRFNQVVGP